MPRFSDADKLNAKAVFPFLLPLVWVGTNIVLLVVVVSILFASRSGNLFNQVKYSVFATKPYVLGASSSRIESDDAKVERVNAVLRNFKCPLAGQGKTFVEEANKNKIPYWLVASISFQESGCGKNTPYKTDVDETYNAWGWGVWGTNIKHFDSWEQGIATVSKYMGDKFYSKGITDTCEIMRIYTPPSNGSWCNGVNYFGDLIQNYSSK